MSWQALPRYRQVPTRCRLRPRCRLSVSRRGGRTHYRWSIGIVWAGVDRYRDDVTTSRRAESCTHVSIPDKSCSRGWEYGIPSSFRCTTSDNWTRRISNNTIWLWFRAIHRQLTFRRDFDTVDINLIVRWYFGGVTRIVCIRFFVRFSEINSGAVCCTVHHNRLRRVCKIEINLINETKSI